MTSGIETEIDFLTTALKEEGQENREQLYQLTKVAREIKTEIANLSGCLNELLWHIRSDNQTGKACGCSKGGALQE